MLERKFIVGLVTQETRDDFGHLIIYINEKCSGKSEEENWEPVRFLIARFDRNVIRTYCILMNID